MTHPDSTSARALPGRSEQLAVLFSDAAGPAFAEAVERCGGTVVPTGGGPNAPVMATFSAAARAVDAAIVLQQEVNGRAESATPHPSGLRIGIDFGPAVLDPDGARVSGEPVSVAMGVHRRAGPRQIFVSDAVRAQLSTTLPVKSHGVVPMYGHEPVELFEVVWSELARPTDDLPRLDPRYVVGGKLGVGGMASVWRARDQRLGREVALKVLHRNLPFSTSMRERLEREARVAAGLTHENVVQVYDFGVHTDTDSFIAMELVEGRSLRSYMDALGQLPAYPLVLIAYEVARGLGYAHSRGVVHRDVKPDNVLLSNRGAVKVADFGIAIMDELARLTASGVPVGTPAYLSPEQVKGLAADARSDVFSFGVMLYEASTGRLPFNGNSASALMYKIVEGNYPAPETLAVNVGPELSAVIKRCLRAEPEQRFKNAAEVADALRPLLEAWKVVDPRATLAHYVTQGHLERGSGSHHLPPEVTITARRPPRRRMKRWVSIALAASVASIAATVAVLGLLRPEVFGSPAPAPVSAVEPAPASAVTAPAVVTPPPVAPPEVAPPPVAEAPVTPAATRKTSTRPIRTTRKPPAVEAGTLHVVVSGGWADILVDGKPKGRTPPLTDLVLPAGPHTLELRNPMRAVWRQKVQVAPGATSTIRAELRPLP